MTKNGDLNGETPADNNKNTAVSDEQIYIPEPDEAQLTFRAVAVGCIVGSVVACTNIYIGLKIGWTFGASIISAVLGYAAFTLSSKRLTILETNISQTAGSAAGSMASASRTCGSHSGYVAFKNTYSLGIFNFMGPGSSVSWCIFCRTTA